MACIASDADNNPNTLMHYYPCYSFTSRCRQRWMASGRKICDGPPKIKMFQKECIKTENGNENKNRTIPAGKTKWKKTGFSVGFSRLRRWEMAQMQSLLKETGLDSHLQVFRIKRLCFHTECSVDLPPLCIKCFVFSFGVCDVSTSSTVLCVLSVSLAEPLADPSCVSCRKRCCI